MSRKNTYEKLKEMTEEDTVNHSSLQDLLRRELTNFTMRILAREVNSYVKITESKKQNSNGKTQEKRD